LHEYKIAKFFASLPKNIWHVQIYFLREKVASTLKSIFVQQRPFDLKNYTERDADDGQRHKSQKKSERPQFDSSHDVTVSFSAQRKKSC
jgi:hypothetical protein